MYKYDIEKEIKSREYAKDFFSNYFNNLMGVEYNCYDYHRLREEYVEYLEAYFNDELSKDDRDMIKSGYNYVKLIFTRGHMFSDNTSSVKVIRKLWEQYMDLEQSIAGYRFEAKRDDSKGGIQNAVNSQIIDELSLFHPLICDILLNLKYRLSENKSNDIIDNKLFFETVKNELADLCDGLEIVSNKLFFIKEYYQDCWNDCMKPNNVDEKVSYKQLGQVATQWRKKRNEGCQHILSFVNKLIDIDIAVYYGTFDYKNENYGLNEDVIQRINYYNQCVEYLQHSNNYFCYLSQDDKQEIALKKVLKRK